MDSQADVESNAEPQSEAPEDDDLLFKANKLMEKINLSPESPSPKVLHALSTILESEESRSLSLSPPLSTFCRFSLICLSRLSGLDGDLTLLNVIIIFGLV